MNTRKEQATIAFYQWEARARGYLLCDDIVEIEPPFAPFVPVHISQNYDDGKVPSLLGQAKQLLLGSKTGNNERVELPDITPRYKVPKKREAISVFFPHGRKIDTILSQELLNLLCYSQEAFSFEIVAQNGSIEIIMTAGAQDMGRLKAQLKGYFPDVIIRDHELFDFKFDLEEQVAIADFALDNEFMLPTQAEQSFVKDPLTSIIASLESIKEDDVAVIQIIFKGISAPWAEEALYASSDGKGGSFFEGHPEFIIGVKEKINSPLFGVIFRIAAQGNDEDESSYIAQELARSISTVSNSGYNKLIPLSNEGYNYTYHIENLYNRTSHRLPFILNTKELAQFVHYPNNTIVSKKLGASSVKTKAPKFTIKTGTYLGENIHIRNITSVFLDTESRLSHTLVLGATGTGKSTLVANMALSDINAGFGCAVFDPHGDLIDDILKRIPEHLKDDVILIDPSDIEFPIGFNLLEAKSEAQKIVLASDLVSAFKRHATAWGDTMTSVLSNAVATILESTQGGTLIELKRFLIEDSYRKSYLTSVQEPSLHYYWSNEYPMVKKRISPLLTRIDTFLRPKLVRYMLAQKTGVDVGACMQENKILLLKLSQGLIGESNSYLLASLFMAKVNQAAMARQSQTKDSRKPYMLYCDEYQNYLTPSIEKILSGARKYSLGLTLANQELAQIQDPQLLNSILSNPKTRICFRLGDSDAKRLESGFSFFEQNDLQNLNRGEAIMRIGSSNNDFNLVTHPLGEVEEDFTNYIINSVRNLYAQKRADVEQLLYSMLPNNKQDVDVNKEIVKREVPLETNEEIELVDTHEIHVEDREERTPFDKQKADILEKETKKELETRHRDIQNYVLSLGQERNFISQLEAPTKDGGRIDVLLKRDNILLAVEVSVTNTIDYEVQNLKKCLSEDTSHVYLISESKVHLKNIHSLAKQQFEVAEYKKLHFGTPAQFLTFLGKFDTKPKKAVKRVRGYRVKSNHVDITDSDAQSRNQKIQEIILQSSKKGKE